MQVSTRRIVLALVALVLLGSLPATTSHAGLGGLARTVKGKATKAAAPAASAASGDDMAYDDIMLELTPARIDAVLKGLAAARAATAGRADLVAKQQKATAAADALRDQHGAEIDAAQKQRDAVVDCLDAGYRAAAEAHQKELQARGQSDPAFLQQMMLLSMQLAQAQAKGDTTEMKRKQAELLGLSAPTHAESLAVQARCGPVPAPSPFGAQLAALTQQAKDADESIRALDAKAAADGIAASGLEPNQYAMARERIEMYLARAHDRSQQRGFSAAELAALDARRADLAAAIPAP